MDFTESFDQFSSKLSTMDLALYAGVGIVLWVMFKDKLSPVQKMVQDFLTKVKSDVVDKVVEVPKPVIAVASSEPGEDVFFDLVKSWKQTRDLAVQSGCDEAVKVADEMFPYLNHTVSSEVSPVVVKGKV